MLRRKFFIILYIISLYALVRAHSASSTLFNNIYELFFMILAFLSLTKIHKKIFLLFSVSALYFILSAAYILIFTDGYILDFLLIYKFFVYAILLSILFKKQFVSETSFFHFYKFLVAVFALKYFFVVFFKSSRPTLFFENNFELMLLSLVFYLYYVLKGKVSLKHQVIISVIFLLAQSISGLLILVFVLGMVNIKQILKKIHIVIPGIILLGVGTIYVLKDRLGGELDFRNNDRFKFLTVFLNEIENWDFINYLFGASRITPLSEGACRKLGYWQSLFSYSGDGSCYSVVLHSYIFRVVFDHGFIGLLFICYFVYSIIIRSGFSRNDGLTVLGIVFINGISVSSFNSIYFVLGIMFFLIVKKNSNDVIKTLV